MLFITEIREFLNSLKWNGQIWRFFDENMNEFDLICASVNTEAFRAKWTTRGYKLA